MQDGVLTRDERAARQSEVHISIQGLSQRYVSPDGHMVEALQGIDLEIGRGELVCLLGPSGCGKSTLLNILAGFLPPTSGTALMDGVLIGAPSAERCMVFQDYALFPWMSVAENIAFGLRMKRAPTAQVAQTVEHWLCALKLQDFAERFPKHLSGGMRQRVAIARALAVDPPILLMDEPFAALDALTRRSLQDELLRIWESVRKTIVFVTHSIDEAILLADRIVILTYRPGRIKHVLHLAEARPRELTASRLGAIKRHLTDLVMEEQQRFLDDEASNRAF